MDLAVVATATLRIHTLPIMPARQVMGPVAPSVPLLAAMKRVDLTALGVLQPTGIVRLQWLPPSMRPCGCICISISVMRH